MRKTRPAAKSKTETESGNSTLVEDDDVEVGLNDDTVLEDEEEDNVSLDDLTDVASEGDES